MHKRMASWLFILLALFMFPAMVWANDLSIEYVETPPAGSPAASAEVSVYFSLRTSDNLPISGIQPDNCSVLINGIQPKVVKSEMASFKEGNRGVGVLFIFPVAKNYAEDSFAIRANLSSLLQLFDRDIDQLNLLSYDVNAQSDGWKSASSGGTVKAVNEIKTSEVLEPNLFASFQQAVALLKNLEGVSQKYVVIISDAEGAIVGQQERAIQLIGNFTDQLKKEHITPIVIGYSPDGAAAMTNVGLIKRIATNVGGAYFQAERTDQFQKVLMNDVYNYIFERYIYRVTLDMDENYLEQKKYNLQLIVKTKTNEDKAAIQVAWPELSKNRLWLWLTLGGILLLGIAVTAVIIVRRRQDDEEEFVDEGPQEVCCATCGKVIPQQLFGFNGEFCLSGGLPDCPYYQMPDRGKLQITRGPLADTTFFIKKDMTTIGCYPENDIYLADKSVSRKHAAIKTDEGKRYELRDFGSSNGTYINNEKVERKFLKDGDILRFGTVETVFKLK